MNSYLVSVIIPFFNLENFLEKSINSVLSQTYKNIELILINDGSTDSSFEIAGKYQKQGNIRLIETKNGGPGSARNAGLLVSKGDFIVYLDGDDWLQLDMVEKMIEEIIKTESDILLCKFKLIDNKNNSIFEGGWKINKTHITGSEAIIGMYSHQLAYTVWAKMFKRIIIEDIDFPEKLIFEDRPFMLEAFLKSKKVSYLDEMLVNVLKRSDSLTRRLVSERRIKDLTAIYKIEKQIIEKHNLKVLDKTINRFHLYALRDAFFLLQNDEKKDKELRKLRGVLIEETDNFFNEMRSNNQALEFKDRLHATMLKLPKFFGWKISMILMNMFYK